MPPRRRSIRGGAACLALGLGTTVLTGCTADAAVRQPGAGVTTTEAEALSRLLQRNYQRGGADFVVTAPYGPHVVLTLSGEVDFRHGKGRAGVVTSHGGTRPDDTATVFFTGEQLWIGDVPGLTEALRAAAADDAAYVRRPVAAEGDADADLVDVLVRIVLNLAHPRADGPRAFTDGDWTWQGQRSIDGRLSMVFAEDGGPTVAVDAADDLLLQYVSPIPGQRFEATVTLAGHGPMSVPLPGEAESADVAEHPELARPGGF